MPTYVYKCDTCGAQFEKIQSFKDEPIRTCPRCESAVRRVFQPVGIVFKGSGWYITDSRKSSSAAVGTTGDSDATTEKADTASTTPETAAPAAEPASAPAKTEAASSTSASATP